MIDMDCAAIALIVYRRKAHLERMMNALLLNKETADTCLYVFSDGARDASASADVEAVRAYLDGVSGFRHKELVLRQRNYGLADNTMDGVSYVLERHSKVIMLEDDNLVSPYFLRFVNAALDAYENEPKVSCVSGYRYPIESEFPEGFFLLGGESWGIGTWRDRWTTFNRDAIALRRELTSRALDHPFNLDGSMNFSGMLDDFIAARNNSWAIRWHASCYLRGLLTLYPGKSLLHNIGFDGVAGTHAVKSDMYDTDISLEPVAFRRIPVIETVAAREAVKAFFRRSHQAVEVTETRPPFPVRVLRRLIEKCRCVLRPDQTT